MSKEASPICSRCHGAGFRHVEGKKGVVKCECKNDNRAERLIHAAEIPRKYANCRLDNYTTSPENPYLSLALIKAEGYVDQYFERATPKGLLFQGTPGLGKTHLAVGIIRRLIELKSISCFFCNFASELQRIRDSMSTSKTLVLPRLVYDAEVLILDDFGAQRWSGWVQDQMSNVISNRYDNGRATIITTNLSDKPSEDRAALRMAAMKKLGIMNHEGNIDKFAMARLEQVGIRFAAVRDEPETLEEQVGDRLRSRLYEMCDVVPMYGNDYRRLQAERARRDLRL
jgi:DNA replication protein DnaC